MGHVIMPETATADALRSMTSAVLGILDVSMMGAKARGGESKHCIPQPVVDTQCSLQLEGFEEYGPVIMPETAVADALCSMTGAALAFEVEDTAKQHARLLTAARTLSRLVQSSF